MIPIVITEFTETAISMFALLRTGNASKNTDGTWQVSVNIGGPNLVGTFPSRMHAIDWMCAQIVA
jgi:hypothetical protein